MSVYCAVCYTTNISRPLSCGSYCGTPGILNWAKTKVIHDRIRGEVNIPCPNYIGKDTLNPQDLIEMIGIKEFENI